MRDRQKRRRERTWAEAAKMVLENYSDAPMTPKQILNVIEAEGLKETKSGSSPLACLNAMLHSNARTREALFYKLPGRISLFTMKKNAVHWSRVVSLPDDGGTEDTADEEGSQWEEGSSVPAETSGNASSSRESHVRETQSLVQINKQKRSGVLLPRVVLTPLKVNGAHLPSTSGLSVRRVESEASGNAALRDSLTFHRQTTLSGNSTHHLRSIKNISVPGQVKKKEEEIDFETPGSILVNTNLRALINVRTFNALPMHLQQQLLLLLPDVDRQVSPDGQLRMSCSALNNEFFAHACQRWRERLAEGEFTPEAQMRMRQEMGKEKKVEDWKEMFFEDFYGQKLGYSEELGSDLEEKSMETTCLQQEKPRTTPEPAQKQEKVPEVHIRTRRSLYRNTEKIQRNVPTAAEVKASTTFPAPPERTESDPSSVENRLSPQDDLSLPSTSERVPELHPETASEQKRKSAEPDTSSPSIEKKPRMEQRQSFRNTIQSVHPEKPQPTKEEPKVPPIRIQLSRIKPPWVVKGLPAYQICPRIIPNPDPTGCWPFSCSPADSQTCDNHSQASGGEGRGDSGFLCHQPDKRSCCSRGSRRSRKRHRHREKSANHCRTQLLPAITVKPEKPEVPRVKIRVSSGTVDIIDDCGLTDSLTKEHHLDNVSPPEDLSQCGDQAVSMADAEEENMCSDERMLAPSVDGILGQAFETASCVLGDVSNTFQNRIKQATSCSTEKDSSEKKPDAMPADIAEHHVLPTSSLVQLHSLDTTKTSPLGQLPVHVNDPSTPGTLLDAVVDLHGNGRHHDSVPYPSVSNSQEPNDSDPPHGALQAESFQETLVTQQSLTTENVGACTPVPDSLNDGYKGNLEVASPIGAILCTAEDDLPKHSKVSDFSVSTNRLERLCMPSGLSPPNLEPGKHGSPGSTTSVPSSDPCPFKETIQSLNNSFGIADKIPLLLDMSFLQFPKEMGVRVQLPVDLARSPHHKMKESFLEMLSQDVGSYHYSAGVRLSSSPGVTGSASLSVEVFSEHSDGGEEQVSLRCSCSFKAMTLCEGCGAFCHIDCIGPSKLCVSCLVIR
ncbi:polycomb group protein ASXL1 isoform X2 [Hyla sarda]|uniref:polycomb group protein ASXL1 isoform X2 n=1 Tax=Hyla sarda TaxID=327740 RepID=UPI0024C24112|nr:polycomb group protein ASXL1 isoform X2 [Hyla sarda]